MTQLLLKRLIMFNYVTKLNGLLFLLRITIAILLYDNNGFVLLDFRLVQEQKNRFFSHKIYTFDNVRPGHFIISFDINL